MIIPDPPIICKHCQKDTGYTNRGLMHFVIPHGGLRCQSCGEIFLEKTEIFFSTSTTTKIKERLSDDIVEWGDK